MVVTWNSLGTLLWSSVNKSTIKMTEHKPTRNFIYLCLVVLALEHWSTLQLKLRINTIKSNVGFWGEEKKEFPQKTNKLNPHLTPDLGIEPGPHWWEANAFTTVPSLHPPKSSLVQCVEAIIDHFTVVFLVACPLNESEAWVDLVLIETSLLFICQFLLISMRKASLTWEKQGGSYQNKVTSCLTFIQRPGN